MNKDIIGQSIETIDNELNMMQIKLEQEQIPMSNSNSERFHEIVDKNQTFGHSRRVTKDNGHEINWKLKELIYFYKERIRELR